MQTPWNMHANTSNWPRQKLIDHTFEMWIKCVHGDLEAFKQMREYNVGDILSLEGLYLLARPFAKQHPNMSLYYQDEESKVRCPTLRWRTPSRRGSFGVYSAECI